MKPPCDEVVIRSGDGANPCAASARVWVFIATILSSSMAFIDSTLVNVALPAVYGFIECRKLSLKPLTASRKFLGEYKLIVSRYQRYRKKTLSAGLRAPDWDFDCG